MTKQIESGLTNSQRDSLEIVEFIFHIIESQAQGDEKLILLDEVKLHSKQEQFFLKHLRDIATGTQYIFKPDAVHLKEKCEQLINQPERFVELSRQITSDFSGRHKGNMAAGVFVVAIVKYLAAAHDWRKLVYLVKMDKRPSFTYSYTEIEGKRIAIVEEVENSLNEDKDAIQKSALIDVSDYFVWGALALDRKKSIGLGDYFREFLGVTERQNDSTLTRLTHITLRQWIKEQDEDQLPPNEDANTFAGRSFNYLNDHDTFDTDDYLNTVVRDEDETRKAKLIASLREQLDKVGVAGQQFRPMPNSLPNKEKKQIYQTAEGVTIIYQGDNETAGITITDTDRNGIKRTLIQIETNRLDPK